VWIAPPWPLKSLRTRARGNRQQTASATPAIRPKSRKHWPRRWWRGAEPPARREPASHDTALPDGIVLRAACRFRRDGRGALAVARPRGAAPAAGAGVDAHAGSAG